MELTESLKTLFTTTAAALKGHRGACLWRALSRMLDDIRAIVDGQSQTDPQFRNQRLYTGLALRLAYYPPYHKQIQPG